jgi:hypothetical protein
MKISAIAFAPIRIDRGIMVAAQSTRNHHDETTLVRMSLLGPFRPIAALQHHGSY